MAAAFASAASAAASSSAAWFAAMARPSSVPKCARPAFYSVFSNDAHRARYIVDFVAGVTASAAHKASRAAAAKAFVNPYRAGDILSTSWGYDQTNVDFYTVVRVSGRKLTLASIAAMDAAAPEPMTMAGYTVPVLPAVIDGPEFTAMATANGVKVNGHGASRWDGKPKYYSTYA